MGRVLDMKVVFTPFADRVLVRPVNSETKTKSGIIIPEAARKKPNQGVAVAVGPGINEPLLVKKGDHIIYSAYAGVEFEFEGEKFLIMRESDIFGSIQGSDVREEQ